MSSIPASATPLPAATAPTATPISKARQVILALLDVMKGPLYIHTLYDLDTTVEPGEWTAALRALRHERLIVPTATHGWTYAPASQVDTLPSDTARAIVRELEKHGGEMRSDGLRHAVPVSKSAFARAIRGLRDAGYVGSSGAGVELRYHLTAPEAESRSAMLTRADVTVLRGIALCGGVLKPRDIISFCPDLAPTRAVETVRSLAVRGYLAGRGRTNDRAYVLASMLPEGATQAHVDDAMPAHDRAVAAVERLLKAHVPAGGIHA
jgi:hypothetical protein